MIKEIFYNEIYGSEFQTKTVLLSACGEAFIIKYSMYLIISKNRDYTKFLGWLMMLQRNLLSVLVMLMRSISDSQIELKTVLKEGAETALKSAAFAAKWVCEIKNQCMKKYSKTDSFYSTWVVCN